MMNLEYEKLSKLDIIYNKAVLNSIYLHLKRRDQDEKLGVYDPMLKENIELGRAKLFLKCWSLYFKKLYPLLLNKPRKTRIELIHLIFGNAVNKVELLWFSWPSLLKFAQKDLDEKLEKHIQIIKNNINYDIN